MVWISIRQYGGEKKREKGGIQPCREDATRRTGRFRSIVALLVGGRGENSEPRKGTGGLGLRAHGANLGESEVCGGQEKPSLCR